MAARWVQKKRMRVSKVCLPYGGIDSQKRKSQDSRKESFKERQKRRKLNDNNSQSAKQILEIIETVIVEPPDQTMGTVIEEDGDGTPSPLMHGPASKEGLPKFHFDGHVDPKFVYFTQGYINPYFSHAPGQTPRTIYDLQDTLRKDPSYMYKVPVIRVSRRKGHYYSPDNRRLWVFRNSNLASVPCKLVKWSLEFGNKLDNGKKEMRRTDVVIREEKKKQKTPAQAQGQSKGQNPNNKGKGGRQKQNNNPGEYKGKEQGRFRRANVKKK